MAKSIISWTDYTFNPWMGCSKVSPGCKNCYAERLTRDRMGLDLWGNSPRRRTKTTWQTIRRLNSTCQGSARLKVFCGSLCDFFENHPVCNDVRPDAWNLMRACGNLDFQLLTKRPVNIAQMLPRNWGSGWTNVWIGTSIESNDYVSRADLLRSVPAAIRFVSYEPALGPLDKIDLTSINWLIYGGESGPGYRAEDKQWARDIMAMCQESGTAFFHKQSAGFRTEQGIELDGEVVQEMPVQSRWIDVK